MKKKGRSRGKNTREREEGSIGRQGGTRCKEKKKEEWKRGTKEEKGGGRRKK